MNFEIARSLTAVTFALTVATAQAAAPRYQLSDLGTFGGPESDATAIDRSGLIVGYSNTHGVDSHYRAFGYAGGVMSDLGGLTEDGESFATAVNAAGAACGHATTADFSGHAVVFKGGQVLDIGALRSDWVSSAATGINRAGHVAGTALSSQDYRYHAFVYRKGHFKILPAGTRANAINDQDQVTGATSSKAFLYDHGQMTDLGTLGGGWSEGVALNQAGAVTGWAATPSDNEAHAFVWRNGSMTDLGTLGGWQSQGKAIDEHGVVVGWSTTHILDGGRGFVTVHGKMTDLNTLLDPVSGAGWTVTSASAIGRHGEIVAQGVHKGFFRAVLLTPMAP